MYRNMLAMDASRYTVATIAERVGKNPSYITQRLRLTDLAEPVANAFLEDQIGVGHALEIAKLPPGEQERAFAAAFKQAWNGSREVRLLLPLRDLTAWIEQNILLQLDSVPFDKGDERWFRKQGPARPVLSAPGTTRCSLVKHCRTAVVTLLATTGRSMRLSSSTSRRSPI